VWHEMLTGPPIKVTVTPGGTADVAIALAR
jgi:hypothetical protein